MGEQIYKEKSEFFHIPIYVRSGRPGQRNQIDETRFKKKVNVQVSFVCLRFGQKIMQLIDITKEIAGISPSYAKRKQ